MRSVAWRARSRAAPAGAATVDGYLVQFRACLPTPSPLLRVGILREHLREAVHNGLGNHARDVAAESRDFAHETRRQERMLRARRDEERVDAGQTLIHLR